MWKQIQHSINVPDTAVSYFPVQPLSSTDGETEAQRRPVISPGAQRLYLARSSCDFNLSPCSTPTNQQAGDCQTRQESLLG